MRRLLALMLCAVSLGVGAQTTVFNVDMTCAPEFDNVFVTGPWCGWCANDVYNTMTDPDGDGIYSVEVEILGFSNGDPIEYKYAISDFYGQERLVNDMVEGATCAPVTDFSGYANRLTDQGSTTNDYYGTCDGDCNDYGCTDLNACNYDNLAEFNVVEDGSCDYSCYGCTDPETINYNPEATVDGGDCVYCDPGTFILTVDMFDSVGDGWNGLMYGIFGDDGTVYTGSLDSAFLGDGLTSGTDQVCLAPGCYSFQTLSGFDPTEISVTLSDQFGTEYGTVGGGETYGVDFTLTGQCDISGCTDFEAPNFNPSASIDDGSCECDGDGNQLDACGVCNGPGEIYECGCVDIPEGNCDCDGNQLDALGVCGGDCAADADADGICDDVDPCVGILDVLGECNGGCGQDFDMDGICDDVDDCVGVLDPCGICNGPGEVYECGCDDLPEDSCDCDGNVEDALGVCGGVCTADEDMDGICDDVDDCVGELDACGICNGPGAVYECGCSDIPQGYCDCDLNQLDALGVCGGDCAEDANADGICDDLMTCAYIGEAFWQDLELGVYIPEPTPITPDSLPIDGIQLTVGDDLNEELVLNVPLVFVDEVTDGAFQVLSWSNLAVEGLPPGVELILPQALDGGSQVCVELTGDDYPTQEGYYEVVITGEVVMNFFGTPISLGDVSTSFWVEVVSNPNGVPGCTYPTASNYMPWATYDSGVCEYAGCTDPSALNYSPRHSVDDGSCFYNDPNCVAEVSCPEDINGDGVVGTPDLLLMLGEYGNYCD